MNEPSSIAYTSFVLPPRVASKVDLLHLVRDAEQLDDDLTAYAVHAKAGSPQQTAPRMSERLKDFLRHNKITINKRQECNDLVAQLRLLKDKAPVVHMTFAVEVDREALEQLVNWVRDAVHPQALVEVGLQPALVAGVYVRTPNHVFDLSLRSKLTAGRTVLSKELEALRAGL